jgi:hypothetical protein
MSAHAYRAIGNRVEIANIFHGGRDFEALYPGQSGPENN